MTIQPQPSKVIFEVIEIEGFYRIRKSEYYSGDVGNPPLVKMLNLRTTYESRIYSAIARCAREKRDEGYWVRYNGEKKAWFCELDLSNGE